MGNRPDDAISAAVLDAVVEMASPETGYVSREDLRAKAIRRESFANSAWARGAPADPETELDEGERFNAIEDGLVALADEAIEWLLDKGHLAALDDGITLGSKQFRRYVPGSDRENDLFHDIRRVSPGRLNLIRESMTALGDLRRYFPVLIDQAGEVVDGRHRLKIDPNWPSSRIAVVPEDRLAVAVAANRSSAWGSSDWTRLATHQQVGGVTAKEVRRTLCRLALLEDPARSDRKIGRLVGISHPSVAVVRRELEASGKIYHFTAKGGTDASGEGITSGKPADSTAGQPAPKSRKPVGDQKGALTEIRMCVRADLLVSRDQIQKMFGVSNNWARSAIAAERALWAQIQEQEAARQPATAEPEKSDDHVPDWTVRVCRICGRNESEHP